MNKTKAKVLESIKDVYQLEDHTAPDGSFRSADRMAKRIYNSTIKGVPKRVVKEMLHNKAWGVRSDDA
jgi:hypothetical protein